MAGQLNTPAILSLISDLYAEKVLLEQRIRELESKVGKKEENVLPTDSDSTSK